MRINNDFMKCNNSMNMNNMSNSMIPNNNINMNNYMNNNQMMNQNILNRQNTFPQKVIIMPQGMNPNMMNQQMPQIRNAGNYQNIINNNKICNNLPKEKYIQINDLSSESLISNEDYYKCTKDKNDLINILNSFLSQLEIQNKSFKQNNNIKDPVFDLIQNEEKKEVNDFFSKNKGNFMNKMYNYLSSQRMSISPNIAPKIIDS